MVWFSYGPVMVRLWSGYGPVIVRLSSDINFVATRGHVKILIFANVCEIVKNCDEATVLPEGFG